MTIPCTLSQSCDKQSWRMSRVVNSSLVAAIIVPVFVASGPAFAQRNTCGAAVYQLQSYVYRVNQVANFEYYQGIPVRCGYNQICAQQLLYQLNMWYQQQSAMVNNWYAQIASQCSSGRPSRDIGGGEIGDLDPDEVEDIEIDDEDRTVRIRIPDNPSGYGN